MMRFIYGINRENNALAVTKRGSRLWNAVEIEGLLYDRLSSDEYSERYEDLDSDFADRIDALKKQLSDG